MAKASLPDLSSRVVHSAQNGLRFSPTSGKYFFCQFKLMSAYSMELSVSTSPNGWTDDFLCMEWFKKSFIPQATMWNRSGKPILLIYDGHGSHETSELCHLAQDNNIILFCLPPHTTHKLQPLDVGVFGPFQRGWIDGCDEIVEDTGEEMPCQDFVWEYKWYSEWHLNLAPLYQHSGKVASNLSILTFSLTQIMRQVSQHLLPMYLQATQLSNFLLCQQASSLVTWRMMSQWLIPTHLTKIMMTVTMTLIWATTKAMMKIQIFMITITIMKTHKLFLRQHLPQPNTLRPPLLAKHHQPSFIQVKSPNMINKIMTKI